MQRRKRNRTSGWKRRIAKACNLCRSKKSKCDGDRPKCKRCSTSGLVCVYADAEEITLTQRRLAGPSSSSGHCDQQPGTEFFTTKFNSADDNGLSSTPNGSQITSTGTPSNQQTPKISLFNDDATLSTISLNSDKSQGKTSNESAGKTGVMLVGKKGDQQRYFGPSSFVSILSSCGLSWIESQTSEPSSRRLREIVLRGDTLPSCFVDSNLQRSFSRESTVPLPPLPEALALIQEYLDNFNHVLPIFHPPTVITLLGQQYSEQSRKPSKNSAWWVSLNSMLAVAQRRRVEIKQHPLEDMKKVWGYVQNAMDVLLDVTLRSPSLASIQALLALALFFLGTPDPQTSFSLTGCAVRNSQIIGLHIAVTHPNLSPELVVQRKRVFWASAILEQAASHRAGRSATLALQDREIDIPSEVDADRVGLVRSCDGSSEVNLFRVMAHLAVIESKVFHKLYSPRVSGRTEKDIATIIEDLDGDLKAYRDSIPVSFNADYFEGDSWFQPFNLEVCRVELEFYYCVIIIHRIDGHRSHSLQRSATQNRPGSRGQLSTSSNEQCLRAARSIVAIIKRVPRCAKSASWISSYISLAALVVLFINTLQQPLGAEAHADLEAIKTVVQITSDVNTEDVQYVQTTIAVMTEFLQIASSVVEKASSAGAVRMERLQRNDINRDSSLSQSNSRDGNSCGEWNNPEFNSSIPLLQHPKNMEFSSASSVQEIPSQASNTQISYTNTRSDYNMPEASQNNFAMNDIENWYTDPSSTEWATDVMSMSLPFPWDWQELSEMQAQAF